MITYNDLDNRDLTVKERDLIMDVWHDYQLEKELNLNPQNSFYTTIKNNIISRLCVLAWGEEMFQKAMDANFDLDNIDCYKHVAECMLEELKRNPI